MLTDKTVTKDDHIAGWDAWAEKQYYGHAHLLRQNYLFDELPFECPEVFTSFRKK